MSQTEKNPEPDVADEPNTDESKTDMDEQSLLTDEWQRERRQVGMDASQLYTGSVTLLRSGGLYIPKKVYQRHFSDASHVAIFTRPEQKQVALKPCDESFGGSVWKITSGGMEETGSISFVGILHRHFGDIEYSQTAPIEQRDGLLVIDFSDIDFVGYEPGEAEP